MDVAFISLFVANNLIGWIGSCYQKISPAQFWDLPAETGPYRPSRHDST